MTEEKKTGNQRLSTKSALFTLVIGFRQTEDCGGLLIFKIIKEWEKARVDDERIKGVIRGTRGRTSRPDHRPRDYRDYVPLLLDDNEPSRSFVFLSFVT